MVTNRALTSNCKDMDSVALDSSIVDPVVLESSDRRHLMPRIVQIERAIDREASAWKVYICQLSSFVADFLAAVVSV